MDPLLATKLFVPQPRPGLVARPRLVERLNNALSSGLVLVSAPAGFGKTTAIVQWALQSNKDSSVAWVQLDEGDNDPVRFWDYFVAALKKFKPAAGDTAISVLHSPQPYSIEAVLTSLINDVTDISRDFVVVLDDYHLIKSDPIHTTLAFLLDHMPPRMHLVIATRADPPLPLPHFRGRGTLVEVGADDLRFTDEEAARLLKEMLGVSLTVEQAAALNAHTEGWVVGLKMAALSMRGEKDIQSFISGFTGSQRYIMDYLVEEVLKRQTGEVRDFLLKTSVLQRMTATLCDFLTGRSGSQETLRDLGHANMFLVPLDESRQWYRYHHLFGELLRHQLESTYGAKEVKGLHGQASQWYEAHGLFDDAIVHSLTAKDWERAMRLIEIAIESRMKRGEWNTLYNWFEAIPEGVLQTHSGLYAQYAQVLVTVGQVDSAEAALGHLEKSNQAGAAIQGEVAFLRMILSVSKGNLPHMAEMAKRALALLPAENLAMRARAKGQLGWYYFTRGYFDEAQPLLVDAAEMGRQAGELWNRAHALIWLAGILFTRGKPHDAVRAARDAVDLAGESPAAAIPHSGLARYLYELNDLEGVTANGCQAVRWDYGSKAYSVEMLALMWMAQADLARGNSTGAMEKLEKAYQAAIQPTLPPSFRRSYEGCRVLVALRQGDLAAAIEWGDRFLKYPDNSIQDPVFLYVPDRLLIARGEKAAALDRLRVRYDRAARGGSVYGKTLYRICQALAAATVDEAMTFLSDALKWGETAGFIRVFIDEGRYIKPLLEKALSQGITPEYTDRLLGIIEKEEQLRQATDSKRAQVPASVKLLSDRELEILRLVAAGLSNRQIASKLVISFNTAKTHIHNISEKLNAKSRTAAIARARELKLI